MTLLIQEWLRAGHTYEGLRNTYGITMRRHGIHSNLVLLKYSQIESPMAERIVQECRGIILDEADGWRIVSRAFDKFFNHGEGHARDIDWTTARVQEKLDGSLAVLYPYAGEWHIATSGTPDACGNVHGDALTFAQYFWETFKASGAQLPHPECNACFYFELTGPANRIVVVHASPSLTLLGARDLETQEELTLHYASKMLGDMRTVREYGLGSFEEIAASFGAISPLSQEGYVVVDAAWNRVKMKHPGYVALHHAKDGMGPKAFVEIARSGEVSEVVSAFPEFAPLLADAKQKVDILVDGIEQAYVDLCGIETQKDFALRAVKTKFPAALFAIRAKKAANARDFVRGMSIDTLLELLRVKP